ncbi:MAG TPA: methyltransferase domain-containing protein [Methanoregulaceae archaeon]|nr:MAG: methyltransferase domain-containing protein [Methanolinea sp.]HON82321.1 methyltransferase domain-containing protein [Methanoregulaceae archaeon]HPD11140.1 methyltransferase domain-containing protein [Methanoregulaceae archaeon]HRT16154.1 methyltransferase domain-containing protein [Methanoregulaceae archaeon]HRU31727.1 methyltransferase domain-containing protein [Methanoregulaceae archaeon]
MIGPGKRVLLVGEGRTFFVRSGTGMFSTDRGVIDLDAVGMASAGDTIESHTGHLFRVLIPRAPDYFEHAKRTGAPMLPRDIGLVIALTGMNRNDVVLDAGTGSGISAIFFGGVAKKVVTYETREDFARVAAENIREAGLANVEVIPGDVLAAEDLFDIVHYDMTIGPEHVRHAHSLLRPGGYLACYTPFIEHLCIVLETAEGLFSSVRAVECIEREMTRSKRGTRPSTRVGHSGYLTIARK